MLTVSLILAGALAAQAPSTTPAAKDFVGSWNVRITDAPDTFVSGGFQITQKGEALAAGVIWRWGSYLPAKSVELKDGDVRDRPRGDEGEDRHVELRLEGETLKGQVAYPDGKVAHFEGKRAPLLLPKKAPVWGAPVTLFDGKTLGGWKLRDPKKKNGWAVVNGELAVIEPKDNADFVSEQAFQDIKLHIEFNVEPKSNSGVYLRRRYEIQILDNPDQKMALDTHGCGAVYSRIAPAVDATKPAGEWQAFDIEIVGRQVSVTLNGKKIVQGVVDGITGGALSPFEGEPGPLMLQGDHGKVRFRNIVVTPGR